MDARGLDAERIASSAIEVLRGLGLSNVRVGIGEVPIVAEIIANNSGPKLLANSGAAMLLLALVGSMTPLVIAPKPRNNVSR